jgi:FG-GAP repeat
MVFLVLMGIIGIRKHTEAQPKLLEIIPSPSSSNISIFGPSPGSHLGGAGRVDNLTDSNHAQCLAIGDFNGDGVDDFAIGAPDALLSVNST